MIGKPRETIFLLSLFSILAIHQHCNALPLSTNGRFIVDSRTGYRVKLTCGNWPGHMEPMIPEGLDKKPLKDIVADISSLKFNCVRLTYSTYMFTRGQFSSQTVKQSLDSYNLTQAKVGMQQMNPNLLNMRLVDAYEYVVQELGKQGVMVVLDNHVSKPKWCCDDDDGNGFFGDKYFSPQEWLNGLARVARRFLGKSQVIGMSMRNELRGPRQNVTEWYRWVEQGATTIHRANPDVLVIVSGLDFDTNLMMLKRKPLGINFPNKLVYEVHWYSWGGGEPQKWQVKPLSMVCANETRNFNNRAAFISTLKNPFPLFLSEFGVDERGTNIVDNRYLSCLLAFAAEQDIDSAIWGLQGSYYLRQGMINFEEVYGVFDINWNPRHSRFDQQRQIMHRMIRDTKGTTEPYNIIYHPQSGQCVRQQSLDTIHTEDCETWSRWTHAGDGSTIKLVGTSHCLKVAGDGLPPILSQDCSSQTTKWSRVSTAKFQIASVDNHGTSLCLQKQSENNSTIVTTKCICLGNETSCVEDTQSQWFKLVTANVM